MNVKERVSICAQDVMVVEDKHNNRGVVKNPSVVRQIISKIESNKASFWECLVVVFAVCVVRNIEETILVRHQILDSPEDIWSSLITFFCHFNSFWFMVFVELVLLLYLFTHRSNSIRNCMMAGLYATPVILLPPVLNMVFGDHGCIAYPSNPLDLLPMLLHFFDPTYIVVGVTIGMRIEIAIAAVASAIYVFYKTKSPVWTLISFLVIPTAILLTGACLPILSQLYENGIHFSDDFRLSRCSLIHGGDIFEYGAQRVALMYIFLTIIMTLIVLLLYDKRSVKALCRNIRPTRSLHYLILFFGGVACSIILLYPDVPNKWDVFVNPMDYLGLFMGAVALFFAFQGAVVFNDLYDTEIDKGSNRPLQSGAITPHRYKNYGWIFIITALYIGFCISVSFFFLLLSYVLLSFLYSVPPFRCRRSLILSATILSIEAVLAFSMGACLFAHSDVFITIPASVMLSMLAAYFLVTPVKDLKDCSGDTAAGIHTLPSLLGPKPALIITCCLVCCVIVLFPICMGLHVLPFSIACAVITMLVFFLPDRFMRHRETLLFVLYFMYLAVIFWALCQSLINTCG